MILIRVLIHSISISHHSVTLITFILVFFLTLPFEVRQYTSPGLILAGDCVARVDIRVGQRYLRGCKSFLLIHIFILVIVFLHGG